jgi:predicted regulator of Ras-like GTPase activity (Roadblock/LC7/MglB family)
MDESLEMLTGTQGVLSAVLATEDGFPLATRVGSGQDKEGMAAAAAAMGQLAGKTLEHLGKGELEVATFEASKFTFLVRRLTVGFLLSVAEPEANVGLIATEMNRAAAALEDAASALAEA